MQPYNSSIPDVSVIIPVFNAARFVSDAIDSALVQQEVTIEVIVINDGSTDDTASVLSKYLKEKRVILLTQNNQGASSARNKGFAIAKGKYIQFLDADDLLAPSKIVSQLSVLSKYPGTIACGQWAHFSHKSADAIFRKQNVWANLDPLQWVTCSLKGGGMMIPAAWLAERTLYEKAGPWVEELSLHDDGEYFCRAVLQSNGVKFVESAKTYYRQVENSLSRRRGKKAAISALNVCIAREHEITKIDNSSKTKQAIATSYAQVAYEFYSDYPDISRQAQDAVARLGGHINPTIGGSIFRKLSKTIGFNLTMKVRIIAYMIQKAIRKIRLH